MTAHEYIRSVKGISSSDSIRDLSYNLDIDDVILLMDGFAKIHVKNIKPKIRKS